MKLFYFSVTTLIICLLSRTVFQFPPNLFSAFIDFARSVSVSILIELTPLFFFSAVILLFISLKNFPVIYQSYSRLPICLAVIIIYYSLVMLWQDKVIMQWLWKDDLQKVVLLEQQNKLQIVKQSDNNYVALLPKELSYLTQFGDGKIWITKEKNPANETTITFVGMGFAHATGIRYSSLDLPTVPSGCRGKKFRGFHNQYDYVTNIRKIMPHWSVVKVHFNIDQDIQGEKWDRDRELCE